MLPQAFLERMEKMMDAGEYQAFAESFDKPKFQALRFNQGKRNLTGQHAGELAGCSSRVLLQEAAEAEKAEGAETEESAGESGLRPVPWAVNGFYYPASIRPGKHPYHEAGVYYIQEPSAMAPVTLLNPRPGERILDLCAAPGGKSTQIAAAMQGEGLLISNEIHPARAKILSENIERMGVCNAIVTNETPQNLRDHLTGFFDKILVDAPCSGEGMFRKNEEAALEWSPENVDLCGERQDEILDCAAQMLRPGGILVYSTCTFAPVEDEGSILRFLTRNPDFHILPADGLKALLPGEAGSADGRPAWGINRQQVVQGENGEDGVNSVNCVNGVNEPAEMIRETVRLWPQNLDGEGHYAAILQKAGGGADCLANASAGKGASPLGGYEPGIGGTALAEYAAFLQELLPEDAGLLQELAQYGIGERSGRDKAARDKTAREKTGRDKAMRGGNNTGGGKTGKLLPMDGSRAGYLLFGENLYRMPAGTPLLRGLKIMRPGLQLGSMKKDRFEPAHALALALDPALCAAGSHIVNLTVEEARQYLLGMTIMPQVDAAAEETPQKGWCQILVDGYSLGWGKMAGGVVKNHYPKGLRKA